MKKLILAFTLTTLLMLGTVYASEPAATSPQQSNSAVDLPAILKSFKPIGKFYLSYQAGWQDDSDNNSFMLKRGYFGADVSVTSYLTARFVGDITSDSSGNVMVRAKYLYGKFHWKGNDTITKPYMEFGLAHMPWLDFEEALNGFRMQDTMYLERNHVFNSADVGVMFGSDFGGSLDSDYKSKVNGHYAGKYGSWQVGVYNGGGYHAKELNNNKVLEGRITVRPVPNTAPGLQFSAFGIVGKGNQPGDNPPDWRLFNGMVSYESQYFTFTGQGSFGTGNQGGSAVTTDGTAAEQVGFSIFAAAHVPLENGGKITFFGRADAFNSDTDVYNDLKRLFIGGVAWHFYKSNAWVFDYQRTNHSVSSIPAEDRVQVTLELGF